jgi:hypothetical protein
VGWTGGAELLTGTEELELDTTALVEEVVSIELVVEIMVLEVVRMAAEVDVVEVEVVAGRLEDEVDKLGKHCPKGTMLNVTGTQSGYCTVK